MAGGGHDWHAGVAHDVVLFCLNLWYHDKHCYLEKSTDNALHWRPLTLLFQDVTACSPSGDVPALYECC